MIVWVYNRWGQQIGALKDVQEFVHSDEVNGNDTVTVITPNITLFGSREIIKGDRLVWRDLWSEWHEHVVGQLDTVHADGAIYHTIYAENSLCELMTDYVDERNSYGFSNSVALTRLLENTRWAVGTTSNLGTGDIKFYHTSAYDGLTAIIDLFGGEVSTTITVGASGVTSRKVNHLAHRGQENGLLFVYGYDMDSVLREVSLEEVYTRIHCFGKGEETYNDEGAQTGYGRRLTFESINSGRDYVEDNNAMALWGLPGANGSMKHSEGVFVWEDCEDAQELLKLGRAKLDEVKEPRISYSATVAVLADAGLDFKNARPGDTCTLRDKPLDVRLSGRVIKVVRYYISDQATQITVGNITRNISDVLKSQKEGLDFIHSRATSWDGAANAAPGFLEQLQKNLNNAFDVGGSYFNSSFELGSIWCSVPLARDVEGNVLPRPSVTVDDEGYPPMAIQLKGGGFRIANSLTSTGDFDWRTFGTGRGFTADEINAGIIRGGSNYWNLETGELQFKQGGIFDSKGNNYWNLDTGEFRLSASTKVGTSSSNQSLASYIQGNDSFANADAEKVFNKLTNNGKVQGITMSGGNLYINASYINTGTMSANRISTGTLQDQMGNLSFNLNTGDLSAKNLSITSPNFSLSKDGVITSSSTRSSGDELETVIQSGAIYLSYKRSGSYKQVAGCLSTGYSYGSIPGYNEGPYLSLQINQLAIQTPPSSAGGVSSGRPWMGMGTENYAVYVKMYRFTGSVEQESSYTYWGAGRLMYGIVVG